MMGEEKEACFLDGQGMSKCVQVIIESGMLLLIDSSSVSRCAGGKVPPARSELAAGLSESDHTPSVHASTQICCEP